MLEETNEKSPELVQGISEDLKIEVLLQAMVKLRPVCHTHLYISMHIMV